MVPSPKKPTSLAAILDVSARSIAELDAQWRSGRWQFLALAVELKEQNPQFIFAHEPDRIGKLEGFMASGGFAIGFVGLSQASGRKRKRRSKVSSWALAEFASEAWVHDHLVELAGALTRTLEQLGVGRVVRGSN